MKILSFITVFSVYLILSKQKVQPNGFNLISIDEEKTEDIGRCLDRVIQYYLKAAHITMISLSSKYSDWTTLIKQLNGGNKLFSLVDDSKKSVNEGFCWNFKNKKYNVRISD